MNTPTERELVLLRAERERTAREVRRIDLEIGRRAAAAVEAEEYTTKASLGRLLGLSHTHVGNLIEAARNAPAPSAAEQIPVMDNSTAGDYVTSIGARIVRSVSGFDAGDVLVQSGLDPRLFVGPDDQIPNVPYMLWLLDSGDWVGVSQATVGYNGTGCDFSVSALVRAGVPDRVAREIVLWRFCDAVDVDDDSTWITSTRWPVHARTVPQVIDDRMVVLFGDGLRSLRSYHGSTYTNQPDVDETGFYPSVTEESHLEAWLRFLNDTENLPEWAKGPRVARVFRTHAAAAEDGFTAVGASWGSASGMTTHPCIVIEQGYVQLWGFYYRPRDTSQFLPDEAYEVLSLAGVYPETLVERDQRVARPWARFLANFVPQNDGLPDRIDVSLSATDQLVHTPSEPARYSG
ncbi:hypothetical protein [Clavibacter michiganensis]|uniref:hypothetical protein n=1 Tax=Clavibacter michiganensis TaxID=28447 RepID=UPI003DA184AD